MKEAVARAEAALLHAAHATRFIEPMAAALFRFRRCLDGSASPDGLVAHWASRAVGNPSGPDRYRWEVSHARGTEVPVYAGPPQSWKAWRPSEQPLVGRDVFAFEEQLTAPIACYESAELLAENAHHDPRCGELLSEAEMVLRKDCASYAIERRTWGDTFGLWCLACHPSVFERLHPVALAAAESYALRARRSGGVVEGDRFPLHHRRLVSATAQLARVLLSLGCHPDIIAGAVRFVASEQSQQGSWGDAPDPPEILTTLVAADLLASTDPTYDPSSTIAYLVGQQTSSGFWRAFGPEAPWLTAQILGWIERAAHPFHARFCWPHAMSATPLASDATPEAACRWASQPVVRSYRRVIVESPSNNEWLSFIWSLVVTEDSERWRPLLETFASYVRSAMHQTGLAREVALKLERAELGQFWLLDLEIVPGRPIHQAESLVRRLFGELVQRSTSPQEDYRIQGRCRIGCAFSLALLQSVILRSICQVAVSWHSSQFSP